MLDFSFGKLAIIFALCLIVLGPEKLPKLAQQLGRFAGQARAMARHFRAQLEQELAAEELAKQKRDLEQSIQSSIDAAAAPINTVAKTVDEAKHEINTIDEYPSANDSGHADLGAVESTVTNPSDATKPADTQR
jgi:sec-independent protein translocase protein TatB